MKTFYVSYGYSLNGFSSFAFVIMGTSVDGVSEVRVTTSFTIIFMKNCLFIILGLWYTLKVTVLLMSKIYGPFLHGW